jgi:DnaJ-class molecular chaperone
MRAVLSMCEKGTALSKRPGRQIALRDPVRVISAREATQAGEWHFRSVQLTIPPETRNGRIFRLQGLGMPNLRSPGQRGDLYATVEVQLPQRLSQREKQLFEQLREMKEGSRR